MINSIESERLDRLIRQKVKRYKELQEEDPDNAALPYLNSEITFLRDSIMPIVLAETTVDYSEIRNFVTRSLRSLENHPLARKTSDLLLHIHLKDPDGEPLAAVARSHDPDKIEAEVYVNFEKAKMYHLPQ